MFISEAIETVRQHHLSALKSSTNASYIFMFNRMKKHFGVRMIESITVEDMSKFLESFTSLVSKGTRRLRYAQAKAFFNFIINECGLDVKNPC